MDGGAAVDFAFARIILTDVPKLNSSKWDDYMRHDPPALFQTDGKCACCDEDVIDTDVIIADGSIISFNDLATGARVTCHQLVARIAGSYPPRHGLLSTGSRPSPPPLPARRPNSATRNSSLVVCSRKCAMATYNAKLARETFAELAANPPKE